MLESLSALAIGKQTAIGVVAAQDVWVRIRSRTKVNREPVFGESTAALASLDSAPHVTSRYRVNGSFVFEVDLATLRLLIEHMFGAAAVANIITPNQTVFSAGTAGAGNIAVLQPLTIWSQFAGDLKRITDAQITKLTLKYDADGLLVGTAEFIALDSVVYSPALTPSLPTVFFNQPHVTLTRAGSAFVVDDISLTLEMMIEYYKGANGLLTYPGFKYAGGDAPKRKLQLDLKLVGTDTVSETPFETSGVTAFVLNLVNGANILRWNVPAGQYTSRDLGGDVRETQMGIIARRDSGTGNAMTASLV